MIARKESHKLRRPVEGSGRPPGGTGSSGDPAVEMAGFESTAPYWLVLK